MDLSCCLSISIVTQLCAFGLVMSNYLLRSVCTAGTPASVLSCVDMNVHTSRASLHQ